MVSLVWIRRMKSLADKEQRWGRVRSGSKVSPEEDALAEALIKDGFIIKRQVKIFLRGLAPQAGVPYYLTDFLVEGKLVVEVDSFTHRQERREWDQKRDEFLVMLGYPVLRLTNEEIRYAIVTCIRKVNLFFPKRNGQPPPLGLGFP